MITIGVRVTRFISLNASLLSWEVPLLTVMIAIMHGVAFIEKNRRAMVANDKIYYKYMTNWGWIGALTSYIKIISNILPLY